MVARGVVEFFKSEKGWGAISCDELPDGQDVWVHFSDIEATGYRALEAGDAVDSNYEAARQDSFNFRATRARRLKSGPAPILRRRGTRVVIAQADTPMTPRRHRLADGPTPNSSDPARPADSRHLHLDARQPTTSIVEQGRARCQTKPFRQTIPIRTARRCDELRMR